MRELFLNINNEILKKDKNYLGGEFSILEKINLKGIGSPKLIYQGGNDLFDSLNTINQSELSFVNFELLKKGLLVRVNKNQRTKCIGLKLEDIRKIDLIGIRVIVTYKRFGFTKTKIVHRGELILNDVNEKLRFAVITSNFKSVKKFFHKDIFENKFSYSIDINPPERDSGNLLNILELLS